MSVDHLIQSISANSLLNKSDWDAIDNKYIVNNARKTGAYNSFMNIVNETGDAKMHPHQEDVIKQVETHMIQSKPLRLIYSTPTGSGKTFSSLLLQKCLLKRYFPHKLLIYSVPTKEVLKRVGTDCEAHGIYYWTAGKLGTEFVIRRPYSIRTSKENAGQQRGDIFLQMLLTIAQSIKYEDKIRGRCDVILADIEATARLLEVIHEHPDVLAEIHLTSMGKTLATNTVNCDDDKDAKQNESIRRDIALLKRINSRGFRDTEMGWMTPENVVLFFDEPNMGIHLSEVVDATVRRIIAHLPQIAVLASATMKNWDSLPEWWRGRDLHATYTTVSSIPYCLPVAALSCVHPDEVHKCSIFDLFTGFEGFKGYMDALPEVGMGQLIRHMTVDQLKSWFPDYKHKKEVLESFRSQKLVPHLKQLAEPEFITARNLWSDYKGAAHKHLRDLVSSRGITLIATLNPHQVARALTGLQTPEDWDKAYHDVRRTIKNVAAKQKAMEREYEKAVKLRAKRSRPEDGDEGLVEPGPLRFTMGKVDLYTDELGDLTEESMIFLSHGIAISAVDADSGIKHQFQKAIYGRPEDIEVRPAIHILVVDYASIYGFDCPGVDRIVLMDDLGALLSHEDVIQFVGRLRRDGDACFTSFDSMLKCLGPREDHFILNREEQLKQDVLSCLLKSGGGDIKKIGRRLYQGQAFEFQEIINLLIIEAIRMPNTLALLMGFKEVMQAETDDIISILDASVNALVSKPAAQTKKILVFLYEETDVDPEAICEWIESLGLPAFYEGMKDLIDWLRE